MMNIPIYRAKKIDSDELVEGYLTNELGDYFITKSDTLDELANIVPIIDKNTLAIHMDGMIDKNGKKIFASLSEDGVGGDMFHEQGYDHIIVMKNGGARNIYKRLSHRKDKDFYQFDRGRDIEVIGIHKG